MSIYKTWKDGLSRKLSEQITNKEQNHQDKSDFNESQQYGNAQIHKILQADYFGSRVHH